MRRAFPHCAVALMLCACGASGAEGGASTDDRYREIQRHEAAIAQSRALVTEGSPECEQGCAAVVRAARAADGICARAGEIGDADSATRCRRGRADEREIASGMASDCHCGEHASSGTR